MHLFEFEDLPWFPQAIREGMMDFLKYGITWLNFYEPVAPLIKEMLNETGETNLIELCAGGGGGVIKLLENLHELDSNPKIILTDLYPNIETYEKIRNISAGEINFIPHPVNALDVPASLAGMRILFSSIHHFQPSEVKTILLDATNKGIPIGIFDAGTKSPLTILGILLLQPVAFFFLTPFFKPFRWSRLFFTYILPLIPLCTMWDGCVSVVRFYTVPQLKNFVGQAESNHYIWEVGQRKNKFGAKVNFIIGRPV
jgi:hypothetical protein